MRDSPEENSRKKIRSEVEGGQNQIIHKSKIKHSPQQS